MPIRWVYFNTHKRCFSLMDSSHRVVGYASRVVLRNPRFVVRPGGRKRCLATGRRNVHAFAVGELARRPLVIWRHASYNPHRADSFLVDTGEPLHTAAWAELLLERGKPVLRVSGNLACSAGAH